MNTQSPPTTLSEERLLPCPFCGKQPTSKFCSAGVPGMEDCGYWGIDCTCGMSQVHADDEEFAIEKWNNRHAAEQMARYQWQPIESAPLTTKARLVWCPQYQNTYIVYWDEEDQEWKHFSSLNRPLNDTPTHWMALPPAPEKGGHGA